MLNIQDVNFETVVRDTLTGVEGKVTGKYQDISGVDSVKIEGRDASGRPFSEWIEMGRAELLAVTP